jgi:hypothetical protein
MVDKCKACPAMGSIYQCSKKPCEVRDSWYAERLRLTLVEIINLADDEEKGMRAEVLAYRGLVGELKEVMSGDKPEGGAGEPRRDSENTRARRGNRLPVCHAEAGEVGRPVPARVICPAVKGQDCTGCPHGIEHDHGDCEALDGCPGCVEVKP